VSERLLLDEHFPARLAETLRDRGFDVVAVCEHVELIGLPDAELYAVAVGQGRRLLTENVRDFRPLLARAIAIGGEVAPLLLTTSKRHPRNLDALGSLASALTRFLAADQQPRALEEWLP
jgi:predicted nuclease of predicted toxin-antitoxin system